MERPDLIIVEGIAELALSGARRIAQAARQMVEAHGRCTLALAGGSTPRPVYEELKVLPEPTGLPWGKIDFYFGDERCVPPDHPESNYRMAMETILSHPQSSAERVHRVKAEREDRERAAEDYARLLPDPLDVLLLGMGDDGHTASLFPGSVALRETERRIMPVKSPKPPPWRITITPPVIATARAVLVLVAGVDKAEALARVLEGPTGPTQVPAQLARGGTWIVDRAAASRLQQTS
jgi:6-phosphogluconolactonase